MKSKEPKFMKELHEVREKLTQEWDKLPLDKILSSLRRSGKFLKSHFPHLADSIK